MEGLRHALKRRRSLWRNLSLQGKELVPFAQSTGFVVHLSFALVLNNFQTVAAQNFEYKISCILDKPTESLFGYISVLVRMDWPFVVQIINNTDYTAGCFLGL
jgi:uncharacterized Tic20 family protein